MVAIHFRGKGAYIPVPGEPRWRLISPRSGSRKFGMPDISVTRKMFIYCLSIIQLLSRALKLNGWGFRSTATYTKHLYIQSNDVPVQTHPLSEFML